MSRNHRRKVERAVPQPAAQSFTVDQMFAQAVQHHMAGQMQHAESLYLSIVALPPIQAEASYNLGLIYQTSNRFVEAVSAYRNAVMLRQDHVDAYNNMGTALQALNLMDKAVHTYRTAIAIRPEHETSYCNLGVALKEMQRFDEAVAAYNHATSLRANYDWAYANLAAVLLEMDRLDDAIDACRKALAINEDMGMALFNLGTALRAKNDLAGAEQTLRDAVRRNPDFVEAHFTLGQTLLQQEKYEDGWKEYDWRWRLAQYTWLQGLHGDFVQPRWEGEDISGKTLLIYAEQGLGDAMQYVRYLPQVIETTGAKVVFMVHTQLLRLFSHLRDCTVIPLDHKPLPHFDVHTPLLTVPRLMKTGKDNIPAPSPYLTADPELTEKWRVRIGDTGKKKRVGIVWSGNPDQTGDRLRSPGLPAVMPLFETPDVQFVALQVGPGRRILETTPLPSDVIDFGAEITDLSDTAAIMANLDLMISSCTAPLHLAAALGVPTWGMIPFAPHFLWQNERRDSPWYPTLTLYRQSRTGDWSDVMGQIRSDLEQL